MNRFRAVLFDARGRRVRAAGPGLSTKLYLGVVSDTGFDLRPVLDRLGLTVLHRAAE
jgi:hypothetical protein